MSKLILTLVVAAATNSLLIDVAGSYTSDQQTKVPTSQFVRLGNSNTQIVDRTNETIVVNPSRGQLAQNSEVVDIKGEWNFQQAQKIILPYLQRNNWNNVKDFCSKSPCNPVHTFLSQYKLPYKNKEAILVATASINKGFDCHACAPHLSFFEFEKQTTGWKLVNSDIAVSHWGSWGTVQPSDIKVKVLGNNGDNLYGIVHEGSYVGQGIFVSSTSIYAKVDGSLREVLPVLQTSENNSGAGGGQNGLAQTNWESKITIQPGTKGFFNILVERQGIRRGKPFSERQLLKFNGQKYVPSQL